MDKPKERRVLGLDILRATAILMVICAHYFASTPLKFGGTLGVELFFVLSGFLIGGILIKNFETKGATFQSLKDFWVRRWLRTIPNYIFFLFIFTLLSVHLGEVSLTEWLLYPFFLQNLAWPTGNFFSVSWSLAVEEWFYISFPLVLWLFARKLGLTPRLLLFVTILFLIVPPFLRFSTASKMESEVIRGITVLRLDAMMYGVLMAGIKIYKNGIWIRLATPILVVCGVCMLAMGCALYRVESSLSKTFSLPIISLGTAIALPGLEGIQHKWLTLSGVITYISKISYSAYLLHMPVFFIAENLITDYPTPYHKILERILLIVVVLALSYIPYRLIELPFLSLRNRITPPDVDKLKKSTFAS